ncbi:MAG: hypothetical protein PVSMB7_20350 [Chloroflexota bacterium]
MPTPLPYTAAPPVPFPTATPRQTFVAATSTVLVPPTATPVVTPSTPTPPAIVPARLVFAAVRPTILSPGQALQITALTSGTVGHVEVDLGSGSPTGPAPRGYTLTEIAPGRWSASGTAPLAAGDYHFTVHLESGGSRLFRDNDAWNVTVGSPPPTAGVLAPQPVSPELLAPPFSYGAPQAAVFSAAGRTVNGSEVVSDSRPDIAASTVATYYLTHLPRAGWSVSGSGVPAGVTSFSLSASSGSRVCVVEYSGATVHVFFGTLS